MADAITRQNATALDRARAAGRSTYQHAFVASWPACVDCATPIRHRPGDRGQHRRCGCPEVRWWCDTSGWKRTADDDRRSAAGTPTTDEEEAGR